MKDTRTVESIRADYQIVSETRAEMGIACPEYTNWLEGELIYLQSICDFYRQSYQMPVGDPVVDGATFDGLRVCKICHDRETTRGDGVCESCFQQWQIDQG